MTVIGYFSIAIVFKAASVGEELHGNRKAEHITAVMTTRDTDRIVAMSPRNPQQVPNKLNRFFQSFFFFLFCFLSFLSGVPARGVV